MMINDLRDLKNVRILSVRILLQSQREAHSETLPLHKEKVQEYGIGETSICIQKVCGQFFVILVQG